MREDHALRGDVHGIHEVRRRDRLQPGGERGQHLVASGGSPREQHRDIDITVEPQGATNRRAEDPDGDDVGMAAGDRLQFARNPLEIDRRS